MSKKINQLKSGIILSYINMIVSFISALVITPLMVKALGQSEYGLYQLIGSFAGYLSLIEFGIGTSNIRYLSKYNAENDQKGKENYLALALIIYSIIACIMMIVGAFMLFSIENIFSSSINGNDVIKAKIMFITLVAGMIFSTICAVFSAILTSYEEYFIPKLVTVISALIKLIIMFFIVFICPSAVILTIVTVGAGIVGNIFNVCYSVKKYKVRIKLHYWDNNLFKEVMKFSMFNFMNTLMSQIYWKLDTMIIGSMMSTAMVAIYSIGMQLNTIILDLTTMVTTVTLPRITKLVFNNTNKRDLTMYMVKIGRIILILYGLISLGFFMFGKAFIRLWVGEEYIISYYIASIFIIFAAIPRIQGVANDILKAKNMHGFLSITYVITGVINIVITIILLNSIGLIGAALGTAFSLVIGNIIIANIYYEKKVGIDVKLFFKESFKGIWKVIIISPIITLPLTFINTTSYLILFFQCSIFSMVYIVNLFIFALNKEEKIMLKDLVIRKKVIENQGMV